MIRSLKQYFTIILAISAFSCGGGGGGGEGDSNTINSNENTIVNNTQEVYIKGIDGLYNPSERVYKITDKYLITEKGIYEFLFTETVKALTLDTYKILSITWPKGIISQSIKVVSTQSGDLNVYVLTQDGGLWRCYSQGCFREDIKDNISDYVILPTDEVLYIDIYGNIKVFQRNNEIIPHVNGLFADYYIETGKIEYYGSISSSDVLRILYLDPIKNILVFTTGSIASPVRKKNPSIDVIVYNYKENKIEKQISINTVYYINNAKFKNGKLYMFAGKKFLVLDLNENAFNLNQYSLPGEDINYLFIDFYILENYAIIPTNPSTSLPASFLVMDLQNYKIQKAEIYLTSEDFQEILAFNKVSCFGNYCLLVPVHNLPIIIKEFQF